MSENSFLPSFEQNKPIITENVLFNRPSQRLIKYFNSINIKKSQKFQNEDNFKFRPKNIENRIFPKITNVGPIEKILPTIAPKKNIAVTLNFSQNIGLRKPKINNNSQINKREYIQKLAFLENNNNENTTDLRKREYFNKIHKEFLDEETYDNNNNNNTTVIEEEKNKKFEKLKNQTYLDILEQSIKMDFNSNNLDNDKNDLEQKTMLANERDYPYLITKLEFPNQNKPSSLDFNDTFFKNSTKFMKKFKQKKSKNGTKNLNFSLQMSDYPVFISKFSNFQGKDFLKFLKYSKEKRKNLNKTKTEKSINKDHHFKDLNW